MKASVKEYVFKGSFAPSENSFSAWYVPKYDMILKFKYAYHADFIETYFGVNENKFPDKKVDKIIKEARKELKSILGTTIFYKEFYNIGWVRVNKNGSHCAVSASSPNSNLSDFTTMVNYAIDLNVQEISIEFRNDYDDLVEPKEHMTEEEVAKAFKHSSMLTSKRGQIMKDRIKILAKKICANEIAKTILEQLGGRRFIVMTGAKHFGALPNGLSFRLPGQGFSKYNCVKILLNGMDTYDIELGNARGTTYKKIRELNGIYNDQLVEILERETGLRFSL